MLQMMTVDDEQFIDSIDLSDDGQLLAVAGREGNLHVYLTKLPVLGSAFNQNFAYLSSLYEVSIYSAANKVRLSFGSILILSNSPKLCANFKNIPHLF